MRVDLSRLRKALLHRYVWFGLLLCSIVGSVFWFGTGCGGWDIREPLMRNAPEVDEAIRLMDAGEYSHAAQLLQDYLGTGKCQDGEIGVPSKVRTRADGTFDLGLVLFHIAEKYGGRFGEEEPAPQPGMLQPQEGEPEIDERRLSSIDCALSVTKAIAGDTNVSAELRARAYYLAGNLEFLRSEYQAAVDQYDLALQLIPGIAEDADGDPVGRDAAWNRAIALRRLAENDAGQPDAEPDADPDGGDEGDEGDGGDQDQDQDPDGGDGDAGQDDAGSDEQDQDGGAEPQEPDGGDDEQPADENDQEMGPMAESGEESPEQTRMRMMLEELEDAPSYQQEEARKARDARARRVLEDK